MATPPNPLSIQLFSDPRLHNIDRQYMEARMAALNNATRLEKSGIDPQNQAQGATVRLFDQGSQLQGDPTYTDTRNYPLDQGIMDLPKANAAALAHRTALIAMQPQNKTFGKIGSK